jgi:hypothetical protein
MEYGVFILWKTNDPIVKEIEENFRIIWKQVYDLGHRDRYKVFYNLYGSELFTKIFNRVCMNDDITFILVVIKSEYEMRKNSWSGRENMVNIHIHDFKKKMRKKYKFDYIHGNDNEDELVCALSTFKLELVYEDFEPEIIPKETSSKESQTDFEYNSDLPEDKITKESIKNKSTRDESGDSNIEALKSIFKTMEAMDALKKIDS